MIQKKKNKKGVSVMIGYILLITFAIIMSVIIYSYLKTYVPKEGLSCPEDTSLFIKNLDCLGENLTITLKNNGKFNVAGYFIHATNSSDQELAFIDLSEYLNNASLGPIKHGSSVIFEVTAENSLKPDQEKVNNFTLTEYIYSVEIIPIRFQGQNLKQRLVSCGDSKIIEVVNCSP